MKSINDWVNEAWKVADDHGFHDADIDIRPALWFARQHAQISTLWEMHRNGKMVAKNIATTAIIASTPQNWHSVPLWLVNLHTELSELWEAYERGALNQLCDKGIPLTCGEEEMADMFLRLVDAAGRAGIDLERAVEVKHEYNKTRPWRNGGKRA